MKYVSLQSKAALLFALLTLVVATAGFFVVRMAQEVHTAAQDIVRRDIPAIRSAQQMLLSVGHANEALLAAGSLPEEFDRLDDVQAAQAEFNRSVLTYRLFAQALLLGSDTEAFRRQDGGILLRSWERQEFDDSYRVLPAGSLAQQPIAAADGPFKRFVSRGTRFFQLKRKVLRQRFQGDAAASETVREMKQMLAELQDSSRLITAAMQTLVAKNDDAIVKGADRLASTQAPLKYGIFIAFGTVIGILAVVVLALRRIVLQPLFALTRSAQQVAAGDMSQRFGVSSNDEIGTLARAFNHMTTKIRQSQESLAAQVAQKTVELSEKVRDADQQKKAILNIMEDLEESKAVLQQNEEQLRTANQAIAMEVENTRKFALAVSASTDAIVITDVAASIVYANPAWEQMTGYAFAEVQGRSVKFLSTPKTPESVRGSIREAMRAGREFHSDEFINARKNGSEYCAELSVYPIKQGEEVKFFVGVQRDVTQRKREDSAKSDFVSLASHQLRTPLTAVLWIFDMFRKGKAGAFTPKQQELINDAGESARNMSETVETMLMLSRLQAGKIHPSFQDTSLVALWETVWKQQELVAKQKRQRCRCSLPTDLTVATDARLLKEVLTNLLSNAIKYSPEEGEVRVNMRKEGDKCHIDIADSGYGIPLHQQEKIFSKFFRADNVTTKQTEGNGLGLYLVHSLVELLGGDVTFVSVENQGTTFTVTLPVSPQMS